MAGVIVHPFVNPKADGPDATIVRPSNWNDQHVGLYAPGSFTLATGQFVVMSDTLILTSTQQVILQGTARVRIT